MSPGITLAGKAPWPSHGSLVRLLNYLPKLGYFPPCLITFDYCRVSLWIIFKIKNKANELNLGLGFNMDPVLNYSRNWLKGKFAGNPAFMTGKKNPCLHEDVPNSTNCVTAQSFGHDGHVAFWGGILCFLCSWEMGIVWCHQLRWGADLQERNEEWDCRPALATFGNGRPLWSTAGQKKKHWYFLFLLITIW